MRTTLRLSDELLDQARKEAARQRRTLTSLVEEGLRVVLAPRKTEPISRVELPVSSARGGTMPGVDLNRSAELVDRMETADARGNLVPDAWFAALAVEAGCEWVTLDRDYARFPDLNWRLPE